MFCCLRDTSVPSQRLLAVVSFPNLPVLPSLVTDNRMQRRCCLCFGVWWTLLALLVGCTERANYSADANVHAAPPIDIDARFAAAGLCEARGLQVASKAYSDCFFAEISGQSPRVADTQVQRPAEGEQPTVPDADVPQITHGRPIDVNLTLQGGTFLVPALINGRLTLDFVIDSGASDVRGHSGINAEWSRLGLDGQGRRDSKQVFEALLEADAPCGPRPPARSIAVRGCAMEAT
jgi:hypothetical protein